MKNFTLLLVFVFVFFGYAEGQVKINKSKMLASFGEKTNDFPEAWDNLKLMTQTFEPKNDILAVRLCSVDPLPIAVRMSYLPLFVNLAELETQGVFDYDWKTLKPTKWMYYVPRERVVFLRNDKDCPIGKTGYADTEFWIVPPEAEFPAFVEARYASSLGEKIITSGDGYFLGDQTVEAHSSEKWKDLTPELFQKALQETVDFMKANRTATTIVTASFSGKLSNKILNERINEVRQFLEQNDIDAHRVVIKRVINKKEQFSDAYKRQYPNIAISYERQIIFPETQK